MDKGETGKRAARMFTKPTLGHNLAFSDTSSFARARPRPNELTHTPSNDLTERFYMGARTTQMKPQARAGQTSYTNVHKDNIGSQLSIFDMGAFTGARPHPNDPAKRVDTDALKQPDRMILHGCPHDRNEATIETQANELHEHAQSQPRVIT